jgi:deazaflavin-dependent oxidoreductase (nitroreductase family)
MNRRVTNPLQMHWAPRLPPWAAIEHVGRRSGRTYQTPVIAALKNGTLYVAVLYGTESDWVRNLLAAGGGHVTRAGRRYTIVDPELRGSAGTPGMAGRLLGRVSDQVLVAPVTPV